MDAEYNISNTVQINGISPDSTGKVSITVSAGNGALYSLINSLVIQSYDSTVFLAPSDLKVITTTTSTASLQWSDRSYNESGFELWRANDSGGTFSLLRTFSPNITSFTDSNLSNNHTYYYTVRALKNANGAVTYSAYSNIASAHTYTYSVYLNFTQTNPAPVPWNNTNSLPSNGLMLNGLFDANSYPTSMGFTNVGTFDGLYNAGTSTGNNSGIFPDKVMIDNYGLFAGNTATIQITGLSNSLKYDFTFFASADIGGDVNTRYTIGSSSAVLNASYNTSGTVTIYNVIPDSTGTVSILISPNSSASQFGLIAALIVQGYTPTSSSAPATPNQPVSRRPVFAAIKKPVVTAVTQVTSAKVIAYPNPFTSYFSLSIPSKNNDAAEVLIYNASGKLCYENTFGGLYEGNNMVRINTNTGMQSAGIYIVKVLYKNTQVAQTIKLIKE